MLTITVESKHGEISKKFQLDDVSKEIVWRCLTELSNKYKEEELFRIMSNKVKINKYL